MPVLAPKRAVDRGTKSTHRRPAVEDDPCQPLRPYALPLYGAYAPSGLPPALGRQHIRHSRRQRPVVVLPAGQQRRNGGAYPQRVEGLDEPAGNSRPLG